MSAKKAPPHPDDEKLTAWAKTLPVYRCAGPQDYNEVGGGQ